MREIVVISGKGGTGKTSLTACFALLAKGRAVLADCDVDAADLHLILTPKTKEKRDFWSGREASIREKDCTACGACLNLCRFDAIKEKPGKGGQTAFFIDGASCEGCGVCARFCPRDAIDFKDRLCGVWMKSETRAGEMVHARLGIAAENSGKLVSTVRQEARKVAEKTGRDIVLIDGPPGIGCPVIAAVSGASEIVVVTEPTVSGEHDLARVLELADHFKIPAFVVVNKWDLCPEAADRIEAMARTANARLLGRIRYDKAFTQAQKTAKAVVETDAESASDIRTIWLNLQNAKDKTC